MTELAARPDMELAQPAGRQAHPVARFVSRRIALGLITLVAASILVFIGTNVVPGSPASAVLGRQATPAEVAKIDQRVGYDKPLVTRYLNWLGDAVRGDFGQSASALAQGEAKAPVSDEIGGPFSHTLILALVTIILLIPLSLLMGVVAGARANRLADHVISTLTLVAVSLPEFVAGSILVVVFFVWLNLLPPTSLLPPGQGPLSDPKILVLPVLTLLTVSVAWTVRLVRIGVIDVLKTDYVQMARLNGIPERRVMRRYVLRNSLASSVQVFALSIQYLFGGVIVTEAVFDYPGIGTQLVSAVGSHDNTQVQAIALILAAIYIAINIVADVLVVLLVPKLRTRG
jgi:peptide/nickel transport system permease protein